MSVAEIETSQLTPVSLVRPRRLPWGGVSTYKAQDTEMLTSAQMLRKGNLDWKVALEPTFRYDANGTLVRADATATVRKDRDAQLGSVFSRYEVFQNDEVFAFGDLLAADGGRWVACGDQNGGKRVFMVMELGDEFTVLGGDAHQLYVDFKTAHDGSGSLMATVSPIRRFCFNQNGIISKTAVSSWSFRHTRELTGQVQNARETLALSWNYAEDYKRMADELASVHVTPQQGKEMINASVMPKRAKRDEMVSDIHANWLSSPTIDPELRFTGWGLLNGTTEFMDHVVRRTSGSALLDSGQGNGESAKIRNKISQLVLAA